MESDGFYVVIALEADESYAVADVEYRGTQVAAVRALPGGCEAVLYDAKGVPLDGLMAALAHVRERLQPQA